MHPLSAPARWLSALRSPRRFSSSSQPCGSCPLIVSLCMACGRYKRTGRVSWSCSVSLGGIVRFGLVLSSSPCVSVWRYLLSLCGMPCRSPSVVFSSVTEILTSADLLPAQRSQPSIQLRQPSDKLRRGRRETTVSDSEDEDEEEKDEPNSANSSPTLQRRAARPSRTNHGSGKSRTHHPRHRPSKKNKIFDRIANGLSTISAPATVGFLSVYLLE